MTYNPPKKTDEEVSREVHDLYHMFEMDEQIQILHKTWFQNILYCLGEQWLSWLPDGGGQFARRYGVWDVPTPVSNMIRDHVRSMMALTLTKQFAIRAWPNTEEQNDKDAAKLAEHVVRHLDAENAHASEDLKEVIELWRQLTGNGFCRTFIDPCSGRYIVRDSGEVEDVHELRRVNWNPFNVLFPSNGNMLEDKEWILMRSLHTKGELEETYGVKIESSDINAVEYDYQRTLMKLVANVSKWKGRTVSASPYSQEELEDMAIVKEVEWRPTRLYPSGYYAVVADQTVLDHGPKMPIPVNEKTGRWYYSLTHFEYNRTPGTSWCSGSVDDLMSPQNTINEVDQALSTNRQSLGRPWVLTPVSLFLERISARGSHLLQVRYDPSTGQGMKPQIMSGESYPVQVLEERNQQRQVVQDAGGDPKNILRGQSPHAGASGVLFDVMRETAEMSHTPDIRRFYRAWNRVEVKSVVLAQHHYTQSDFVKIEGEGNRIHVRKFVGADICDNTDVRLELDSGVGTTKAGQKETLVNLVQYGFFQPQTIPPHVQRELLKRFGLGGFPDEQNLHRDRAEYENGIITGTKRIEDIGQHLFELSPVLDPETEEEIFPGNADPLFRMDNHMVHVQVLDQLIFSREFRELNEAQKFMAINHRDLHMAVIQKQMDEMKQEALDMQQQVADGQRATQPQAGPPVGNENTLIQGGGLNV